MSAVSADEQKAAVGTPISLYALDASALGGGTCRFTPGPHNGAVVTYQGNDYIPFPVEIEGISYGGEGAIARPRLTLSRLNQSLLSALAYYDQFRGATLTRLRTFSRYLDGEPEADPNRHWPVDIYTIERKLSDTKTEVSWELVSPMDFGHKQLPGRQVLRDVCQWQYRRWIDNDFDYTNAACPYVGGAYFDVQDQAVGAPEDDKCSRRLSGCLLRFPDRQVPFGGFAGVARVRV